MAKVLLIGGGGREHSVCIKLSESSLVDQIFVAPGNAGTATERKCSNIALDWKNFDATASWCLEKKIDLVFVGPEEPLALGIADFLIEKGISVFGPTAAAAEIEASKSFSKDFMVRHNIPTAKYAIFTDPDAAVEFIKNASFSAHVVKASGLAAGKGVIVATNNDEAIAAVKEVKSSFGSASDVILIEEKLEGPEVSCLAFTDGNHVVCLPPAQDHKRLLDNDQGPNTGGMGAYCPYPLISKSDFDFVKKEVLQKAVDGLRQENRTFRGILYAGVMLTKNGPRVLEFNCRFGDPETLVLLPLLQSDLYSIARNCALGNLDVNSVQFYDDRSALCIVHVSRGYPGVYEKNKEIHGVNNNSQDVASSTNSKSYVVHAGTALQDDPNSTIVTQGGRVLAVVGVAPTLREAQSLALASSLKVSFDGAFYRKDIGEQALKSSTSQSLTYASAGVSIVAGDELVRLIKPAAKATERVGCASTLGLFGALFDLKAVGYKDPLLVSGTDGVGTKLKVAMAVKQHRTVGQDLVAMCVNDILCHGAESLFFLDYYACSKLNPIEAADVVNGIADGCKLAGCALVGGETAEMPGMYAPGDYDLAGFAVGAVEKENLLPRLNDVECGDVLIALPSSGPHSNGFSLIRKIMETSGASYEDVAPFDSSRTFGEILLTPTRIYCKSVLSVLQSSLGCQIKALAHITGGGLIENIPRVLRPELGVNLDANQWEIPPILLWLAQQGGLSQREFCRTFNVGIGLLLIVDNKSVNDIVNILHANGEPKASVVGTVVAHQASNGKDQVTIQNLPNISIPGPFQTISSKPRVRVGVLISGSGTNLQALLEHCQKPKSVCEIAVVISNVAGVQGLERAHKFGVATQVISHKNLNREEFDRQVDEMLRQYRCQLICLAGFMRLLSPFFVQRWRGNLINVHPSLLPSFKGAHAHRLVLESGVRITGATVHYVTEEMDAGAIIAQGSCSVLPTDTESVLAERVKTEVEHQIFPEAMDLVARGDCSLQADGKIIWKTS